MERFHVFAVELNGDLSKVGPESGFANESDAHSYALALAGGLWNIFTFTPIAKFWLAFNHKPIVDDASHGFWRRVRLIPFLHRFEGERLDKDLMKKLRAEAPGILAWAVRGCLQWQQEGLGLPGAVRQATDEYRSEADIVGEFVEEQCVLDVEAHVSAVDLWAEFREWALLNGERMDRRTLANRLEDKGFRKGRLGHGRTRVWFGIRLKSVCGD